MIYAKIGIHNNAKLRFILGFSLGVAWVLVTFLSMYKVISFQNFSVVHSSNNLSSSNVVYAANVPKMIVGPNTEDIIKKITATGLNPIVVGPIMRGTFSVEGKIVTLGGDNINIYEYANSNIASDEVVSFQLSSETSAGSWKKEVYLYSKDNIIVFYMGEKKNIINSLNTIFGQSVPL